MTVDSTQHRVYYEQRLYRNPLVGMLELAEALPTTDINEFVPLFQGVPIARYQLGVDGEYYDDNQTGTTGMDKDAPVQQPEL